MGIGALELTRIAMQKLGGVGVSDTLGVLEVHVSIGKQQMSELLTGGSMATHPACTINSVEHGEISVGKFNGTHHGERIYSLPLEKPSDDLTWDEAREAIEAKGHGHHMMTLAEWALICLMCKKDAYLPRGNNDHGKDNSEEEITGSVCETGEDGLTRLLLEGSGNRRYSSTENQDGIFGLNGNVCNWLAGYRLVDGEIQIIPDNNAAASVSMAKESTMWKAITADGRLTEPGTPNTLHWNWLNGKITLDTETTVAENVTRETAFEDLAVNTAHVPTVPLILRALALFPDGEKWTDNKAVCAVNLTGERLPFVGANAETGVGGGLFSVRCIATREDKYTGVGARPAYCELSV